MRDRDSKRDGCKSLSPFFKQSHGAGVVQYQQEHYRAASTPSSRLRLSPLQLLHVGRLWRVVWCDGRAIRRLTQPGGYGSKSIWRLRFLWSALRKQARRILPQLTRATRQEKDGRTCLYRSPAAPVSRCTALHVGHASAACLERAQ